MDPSYNNSFGTQPPVSSGTGDIILQPDKPAKSKKGIFIGIGVLLVLLVVALVVFLVTGGGKGSNGSGSSSNDNVSVETAFNRYANYLVSGEVKDSEVAINDDTIFSFTESYTDDAVLKKATELYGVFYDKATSNGDGIMNVGLSLDRGKQYYQLLSEIKTTEHIDMDTLYYKYVDGGVGVASNYAKDFYGINDNNSSANSSYRKGLYDLAKIRIEYWDIYNKNGCIVNREYDKKCIDNLSPEVIGEISFKLGDANSYLNSFDKNLVRELEEQCFELSEEIKIAENKNE